MNGNDETASPRQWRVGELAAATGLTVRTLHHYEQLGLLAPSRTEGNHRFYDDHDVERLYRIRALREFGLSLQEIAQTLDDGAGALSGVLRDHLTRANQELERLAHLRDRLQRICASAERLDSRDLIDAIEAMSRVEHHVAERLAAGRASADDEARWRELGERLRACMRAGEEPHSKRVRQVARDVRERLHAFADGDPATLDALARVRHFDPPDDLAGWDPVLIGYLDRALEALNDESTTTC